MNLANEIPKKSEDPPIVKRCDSRLHDIFGNALDFSFNNCLLQRTVSRRNCFIPTNTKTHSPSCLDSAEEKAISTPKPSKQVVQTDDTASMIMLKTLSRHKKDDHETSSLDKTQSSCASPATEKGDSSSELDIMKKAQMNSSWYNIHVAMQSQNNDNTIKSEKHQQQSNATFNDDSSQSVQHLNDSRCSPGMEKASESKMKCLWYDAQRATSNRCSIGDKDTGEDEDDSAGPDDADNISAEEISDMLRKYEPVQLRKNLNIVQQQLESYHSLLDAYEKSKSNSTELEKKVGKYETTLKKLTSRYKKKRDQVKDMENQIIQLKVNLAEAKSQNDYHNAQVRKLSFEKSMLEEANDELRKKMHV